VAGCNGTCDSAKSHREDPARSRAGDNLQRLLERGETRSREEEMGLAHESVRATKEG
jgi:hypothetical protein